MRYEYSWDSTTGIAKCQIFDKNNVFEGTAQCHEADADFMSERTGCYIAECRASIQRLRHIRNNEIKPQIKALKHFYYILKHKKKYFNPDAPVVKCLTKQINVLSHELAVIDEDIRLEKQYLSDYINNKDIIYKRIRKANTQ